MSQFEKGLQRLEAIVKSMESGSLTLEESLTQFQEGVTLVKECQSVLAQAEQKVEVLMKAGQGQVETKPYSES